MKKMFLIMVVVCLSSLSYSQNKTLQARIDSFVTSWLGSPYRFGGMSKQTGIDCSAFVQTFYKAIFDVDIPRTCYYQYKNMTPVELKDLTPGDLVYFSSEYSPSGWHAGVYIGNDEFVHAANYKRGVIISCMDNPWYEKRFKGGRRL